jgi:acetylornithine/N-succinyldiaminopimelate aminotransferase
MIPALMPTYNRAELIFDHGEGVWLTTADGRRFLDFGSGIATSSVGHRNHHVIAAIHAQLEHVLHSSNLYRIPQAERLAQRLVDASFADSVFFCNSGAEANEGMIKIMRRAAWDAGKHDCNRIITFQGAFHGRTLTTLSAAGNEHYLEGFGPKSEGFDQVPYNDLAATERAITPQTCGILLEAVQGEGGIRPADLDFLRGLRRLADAHGLMLGFDEVQCGMGRTGKLFAFEWAGISPDVASTAKGLGGGFPIGAVLARETLARHMVPGTHGSTFGGNPTACAAANAVLDILLAPGFLESVATKGERLAAGLAALVEDFPALFAFTRGRGLMQGLKCATGTSMEMQRALETEGLLTVAAGEEVLRLVPPLVVGDAEIDEALAILRRVAERRIAA